MSGSGHACTANTLYRPEKGASQKILQPVTCNLALRIVLPFERISRPKRHTGPRFQFVGHINRRPACLGARRPWPAVALGPLRGVHTARSEQRHLRQQPAPPRREASPHGSRVARGTPRAAGDPERRGLPGICSTGCSPPNRAPWARRTTTRGSTGGSSRI